MSAPGAAPVPTGVTLEKIEAAHNLIRGVVPVSRMILSSALSAAAGSKVFLKLECEGPTGSFKVRGAYHAIHHRLQSAAVTGVVTSSTGNHGAAVAYAARLLNLPARVYLPENPNPAKRARIAQLGAEIIEVGAYLERQHAARFAAESGWFNLVDGFEPEMLPGTATIASEILDQAPQVDVLFVPVGDSTLIRGIAAAAKLIKPAIKIIGVQAQLAPIYALSFREGHALEPLGGGTIADGLDVREASEANVREIAGPVDEFVLVSEEEMLSAVRRLLLEEHVVAEPAGAATTAALLKSAAKCTGQTVALVVTGSNISEEVLRRAMVAADSVSA
jgi:threonine dehydratase